MVMPEDDEPNYFQRINTLGQAKTLTVTGIAIVYGEGVFGASPANDLPAPFITPFADLQAEADFGTNKMLVRILSPLVLWKKEQSK